MIEPNAIPWWQRSVTELPEFVFQEVRRIRQEQSYRRDNLLRHYRLYSHRMLQGLDASNYARDLNLPDSRLRLNIVQPVVDTAHTLIATNRPRVQFTTEGADWKSVRRAEKMSAFVEGQFNQIDLVSITPGVCRDAEIAGYGALRIDLDGDDIKANRVLPEELEWDDVEAKHGLPRSLFYVVEKSRPWMAALYKKYATEIENSSILVDGFAPINRGDLLTAIEAWHLPSYPGAGDGLHIITTDRAVLFNEPWKPEQFPVLVWRWNELSRGFAGQGLPEQLRGIQLEINRLLYKIQRHMKAASSKIMMSKGSEIDPASSNQEFERIYYTGDKPPVFATVAAIAPQYFEQLDRLYARAFEITGVTQLQAQGLKPAGLDSSKALRTMNDLQSQRFMAIGQSWEQFHVSIADRLMEAAAQLAKRSDGGYKVKAELGGELLDIDWSEIAMERDQYRISAWPVGILPKQPAGQYQLAVELSQDFPQMAPYVLDLLSGDPDLKRNIRRIQAPQHLAEKIIGGFLEDGKILSPEPLWLPFMGAIMSEIQLAYIEAIASDVAETTLDLFRQWIDEAQAMQKKAAEALQPPPVPGLELPGGPGAPELQPPAIPGAPIGIDANEAALALPGEITQTIQ